MHAETDYAGELLRAIEDRSARITVVGLGYVGLPTAVAFAEAGFAVVGADINQTKVDAINRGQSPLSDLGLSPAIRRAVMAGRLRATTDIGGACADADAVLLIVPTPIDREKRPDLSFVRSAADAASRGLRMGQLVVLESTTYPGTTEEILVPALARRSELLLGRDYGVAYCPERYNPGDPNHTLANVHRIVGACDAPWGEVAAAMYGTLNGGRITKVRNLKTAEAAKVIENIQRDLNIALANELALICERIGLDVHEVLDAAATKWNFVRYAPGPGVGGHCLPVDPYYLTSLAERVGVHSQVILAGRNTNDRMPLHVADLAIEALNARRLAVNGAPVAILGLSYKADTGDARETPAEPLVRRLQQLGADLRLCDPRIPAAEVERHFGSSPVAIDAALRGAHLVILLTDHSEFRKLTPARIASLAGAGSTLLDTRNVFAPDEVRSAGLGYRGLGRAVQ